MLHISPSLSSVLTVPFFVRFFSLWLHISSEKLTLSKTCRRVDDVGTGNSDWLISSLCSNSLTLPELTAADNRSFGHQTFKLQRGSEVAVTRASFVFSLGCFCFLFFFHWDWNQAYMSALDNLSYSCHDVKLSNLEKKNVAYWKIKI